MNIYEITQDYIALVDMLENDEDLDEEVLLDTMEGVEGELNIKAENYCKIIKNLEATAKALDDEAKRLAARKKQINNRIEWLKNTMFETMKTLDVKEAGGDILKFKIQKNGGKLPLVIDEDNVPVIYQVATYSTDKEAIRKALEKGEELDFAKFGERGESIRIK